ncbi:unnamed protein product [Orchesella dallaii]|uniref:Uncharacterized protein n=1 Tax=Orchesella dallaii TaxID=48710 RepID=A0ABP1QXR5_9HEXA
MEKDTLDSYISTMTDETDTNAYTFADPFDDTHSVASTSYESSGGSTSSTESNGSVCTVNSFSMQKGRSKSNGNEGKSSSSITNGTRAGGGSGGSKYRSNLKVELVTQLNKSQEANLHSSITTPASSSATVNPSNLYSGNSHLNLQSSFAPAPIAASSSTSTGVPSKYPNNQQLHRQKQQQPLVSQFSPDQDRQSCGGDVKRVRALFELRNHSRTSLDGSESIGSSSNGSTCPSSPESTTRSISSRNGGDTSPCGSSSGRTGIYSKNGRRSRASPQNQQHSQSTGSAATKVLRSAYSNLSLNQMSNAVGGSTTNLSSNTGAGAGNHSSYDFVDLLVNDKVVIEDAPDIYQTNRSRRQGILDRDVLSSLSSSNTRPTALINLNPPDKPSGGSLRRSRSMGTGISALGSPSSACCMENGMITQSSSKTNILAEELPAPDTVKNVRNVFENMLKMRSSNNGSESSVDITPTGFSGSFSIVKKSLSYIKSNPTSRIYRSESMRDDFPSLGRRYGKPILTSEASSPVHSPSYPPFVASSPAPSSSKVVGSLSENVTSASTSSISEEVSVTDGCRVSPRNKNSIERKISEPAKFSPKINSGLSPYSVPSMLRAPSFQAPLTEEDSSFSSNVTTEDYRSRKYVHADVLQKIRSAGTTTTYFGGKIVAKTIKNRKIPLSRRHTFDFQDYVGISGDGGWYSNYDPYNSSNYCRDDETFEKYPNVSSSEISEVRSPSSSRPALDIPLKSSSSTSIYASRNTTISGALDSIFAGGVSGLLTFASKPIDTTPRIISVLPKSPPGSQTGSPVKSCSPVSSVIEEGRNSPEGCEASNEKAVEQDGNNNNLPGKLDSPSHSNCTGESKSFNKKFSQITEGAWF